jgi:NADH-quinone oxidoreductase subunit E
MPDRKIEFMETKDKTENIKFSDAALARINELKTHYPEGKQKSALIPVLHIAQEENSGWLSTPTMDYVAQLLNITPIEVYEVATFYSQFNLKPVGKYVLEVCRTGPCCLVGAEKLIGHLEQKLNIKDGETTQDGVFTLKTVECLGACGYGPVIQIGNHYHEHLNEQKVDELLNKLKSNS